LRKSLKNKALARSSWWYITNGSLPKVDFHCGFLCFVHILSTVRKSYYFI